MIYALGPGRRLPTRPQGSSDSHDAARAVRGRVYAVRSLPRGGNYTFPPLAAAITGGARLLLAMLENLVTDAGGAYAFCDTDWMAVVATEHRGLVPCIGGARVTEEGEGAVTALS